jgi:arginine repressor, C-terminal domain protein
MCEKGYGEWLKECSTCSEGYMVKRRNNRQDAIRDVVRGQSIRTQKALVDQLQALGFNCTQATVSRDIADMGLRKLQEGIYVLAEDLHLQRMVSEFVTNIDQAGNLIVIHSQPGTAPGVAAAVDAASLPEIKGSVAGNDTVLVVADDMEAAEDFVSLINKLRNSTLMK